MANTWWKDPAELIDEQNDILDLPANQSLLIKGPPGSGKTNLLLLRANYLFLGDAPNLFIVVFGSVLRDFIKLGGGNYKFPEEKIVTHTNLFNQILREHGVKLDTEKMDLMEARQVKAAALIELIKDGKLGEIYQALLLDEAQDYFADEIRVFRGISKILIAAADVRQKVYDVDDSAGTLQNCVDNSYELKYHFRNGRDICRLADGIMNGKPGHIPLVNYSSYDEAAYPSRVIINSALSPLDQAKAIEKQLSDQRLAYPNDLIGILCPKNEEADIIFNYLNATPFAKEITRCSVKGVQVDRPIWISTIAAAKGLEFRAVHLAGLDRLSRMGGAQRRLAFTGVTRAKTTLSIYYEQSVPGYLESPLRMFISGKKEITKSNIFGKD